MNQNITDPVERVIADALDTAGIEYQHESQGIELDFYIPRENTWIECKRYFTERTTKQLHSQENIILIQGMRAALAFAKMISCKRPEPTPTLGASPSSTLTN